MCCISPSNSEVNCPGADAKSPFPLFYSLSASFKNSSLREKVGNCLYFGTGEWSLRLRRRSAPTKLAYSFFSITFICSLKDNLLSETCSKDFLVVSNINGSVGKLQVISIRWIPKDHRLGLVTWTYCFKITFFPCLSGLLLWMWWNRCKSQRPLQWKGLAWEHMLRELFYRIQTHSKEEMPITSVLGGVSWQNANTMLKRVKKICLPENKQM